LEANVRDLGRWLESIGLSDCKALFARHDIGQDVLRDLTDQDLERIGLSLGQRRRLLRAITALADTEFVATDAQPAAGARGERRQMTVMFCDLVGSTPLALRLDPEDMHDVLRRFLDIIAVTIARFDGYVARYMGDGVLVYFGWPQAHEDTAAQAARAGVAVVEAVRESSVQDIQVQVRIGIATGLVVVGEVLRAGSLREHVVTGATANLAARLQSVAMPDSVVIPQSTRRLLSNLFDLEAVGPFDLKGIDGPVQAWRVVRERASDSRFQALRSGVRGEIVDRHEELALLGDCWRATQSGAGRIVLLSGEAGIGKTHIVEAFGDSLAAAAHFRLRYQCLPHHASTALHPVIHAIARAAGFEHTDAEELRIAKLRRMLRDLGLQTEDTVGLFAGILSFQSAPHAPREFDPKERKQRVLAVLVELLARLAARDPVLLQFEDAHWSDPTTLELCEMIVERAATLPLMMIATTRPEFTPAWPDAPHIARRLIARLGPDDSTEIIRSVTGSTPFPPGVVEQILAKTDGVPLYLEELTKELLELGELTGAGPNRTLSSRTGPLSVPATLQDSLTARLDRLGWVKEIAQTASVIGRDFSPQLLAPVMGWSPERVAAGLQYLVDAQLATAQGPSSSATYTFRHALIQEAAYTGLLLSERRALHAAIAQTLEANFAETVRAQPEMLAHHYAEARQPELAVIWWHKAGLRSIQATVYAEAIDQLNRALEQLALLPESPDRDRLETKIRIDLSTPLVGIGGYTSEARRANVERAVVLYERTKEDALFPALRGQLSLAYSSSYMIRAVAIGEQLFAAAEKTGERGLRMLSCWLLGMALMGRGRLESALQTLESGLALSDPAADAALADAYSADPRIASLAYRALVLQQLGFVDRAAAADAASVTEAVQSRHSVTIGLALTLRVTRQLLGCDHAALAISATELAELAQRQASQPLQATSGAILGLLRAEREPDERIFAEVRQTIDTIRAASWNVMVGWLSLLEAKICLGHGRIDAARNTLDTLQDVIEPRGHDFFLPELYRLRADLSVRAGAADSVVEAHLRRAMELAHVQRARLIELRSATDLARLWRDQGHTHEARALLAPLYGWFGEGAGTFDLEQARGVLETLRPTG
jgi:class 3 adenylate cyclase/tetratricopeptide (TPR) repeat protein